jgi:urea carboxylase
MKVLAYRRVILETKIPGVIEVTNAGGSLMVHFDPTRIRYEDLLGEVKRIEDHWTNPEKWATDSRLIEIPVWFDDPWSMECYLAHKELHQVKDGSMSNLAYCAKLNGLCVDELIQRLVAPQYLVYSLGFVLGAQGLLPLVNRDDFLTVPKYEVSRGWTPARTFCAGGVDYSIHPYITPGGYQMLGRTAVPVSSLETPERKLPIFKEDVTLAALGDRFRLRSIGKEEYDEIRANVTEGTYEYCVTYQKWEPKKWMESPIKYQGTESSYS